MFGLAVARSLAVTGTAASQTDEIDLLFGGMILNALFRGMFRGISTKMR